MNTFKCRIIIVMFEPRTSIGMASEMMRLWLIYAGAARVSVIFVNGFDLTAKFRHHQYPRNIYQITSNRINFLPKFIMLPLQLYGGILYLMCRILNKISTSASNYLTRHIFNAFDVYYDQFLISKEINDAINIEFYKDLKTNISSYNFDDITDKISYIRSIVRNKYICLHIRTGYYYNEKSINIRNASIENYIDAIKFIIQKGYFVIRLGEPVPILDNLMNIEGYWDYPTSSLKSELMDMWLIKNCDFYVGTLSGMSEVAQLFGKEILLTNSVLPDFRYSYSKKACLLKKIKVKDKDEYISSINFKNYVQDLLENPNAFLYEENTPNQIRIAVEIFLENNKDSYDKSINCKMSLTNYYKKTLHYNTLFYKSIEQSSCIIIYPSPS